MLRSTIIKISLCRMRSSHLFDFGKSLLKCKSAGVSSVCHRSLTQGSGDQKCTSKTVATDTFGEKQSFSTSLSLDVDDDVDSNMNVSNRINNQLCTQSIGRLFAVVHIDGKQRKITTEDIIVIPKPIEADIGEKIRLNKVLLVGGKDFTLIGRPVLNPEIVSVEATVLEKTLSHSIISYWYKRRKDFRRLYLRKLFYTYLRIDNITINEKK